jgi:hypothetical protein
VSSRSTLCQPGIEVRDNRPEAPIQPSGGMGTLRTQRAPLYLSHAVLEKHAGGRAKWSVAKRSVTAGRRPENGVASRDRADSSGATNCPLWPDHLGGTRASSDWP